jgi:putative transposase
LHRWRCKGGIALSDLIWLTEAQIRKIKPYFPLSHGVHRVDGRRIISDIIFVIQVVLRWRDAPMQFTFMSAIYIAATIIVWINQ